MPSVPNSDFLNQAINEASLPALMMSIMHMTGDASLLEGTIRPKKPPMLDLQGGLSEEDAAAIRLMAGKTINDYLSAGRDPVMDLGQDTTERMLAFLLGEEKIADSHCALLLEELDIVKQDPKRVNIRSDKNGQPEIVIIGAGMSGLLLAIRLKQQGINFTIYEKNSGIGGTWFENHYPGCRVDIASHAYSYSFEHDQQWQHYFGEHPELREYFSKVAQRHGILENIQFNTDVSSAKYDENTQCWTVDYTHSGQAETKKANIVVSAVGQLNRPKIPNVPGRDSFKGPQMHTACWDDDVSVDGKRVAVVGAGATSFQMVPALAKTASEVTVFQRTPQWMIPNPDYHNKITAEHNWCFEHLPGYARWFRILSLWPMLDKAKPRVAIDPDWDDGGLSCSAANKKMRDMLEGYMAHQVKDPELLKNVTPQYPPFGTRILQDNGSWLATLQKPHVNLLAAGVQEVNESGLISSDGQQVDVDIIAWATGFETDRFVWPMEIHGRQNAKLSEEWAEVPKSYLGVTVPKFPNFFCLYGPNTNVAHTGNIIFVSECQVRYIMQAIGLLVENKLSSLEVSEEVTNEYETRLCAALDKTVWSHPNVHGFYRLNSSGRVAVNMPWDACDYWKWTKNFNADDYLLVK